MERKERSRTGRPEAGRGRGLLKKRAAILMMTLAARMREREEETLPAVSQAPGRFMICCRPEEGEAALCRESFDTVFAGLALLAEHEPEHVSVRFTDGEESGE